MKLETLHAAIVVLAKQHNPAILHPSFLRSEGIVPVDWELGDTPVSTPVFAMVKYKNRVAFTVQENRFQVEQSEPIDDISKSPLPGLALKYTQKLPHVEYHAVGINFKGFIEHSEPEAAIMKRFLKPGVAEFDDNRPDASAFRFVYSLDTIRLRLSFDSGKIKAGDDTNERSGVMVDANYHADLDSNNIQEGLNRATSLYSEHYRHFVKAAKCLLAMEIS